MAFFSLLLICGSALADQVDGLYAAAYGQPTDQAVLFLHGGPGYNSYSFEKSTAETLAQKGYYVVVFDQRGCGRSAKADVSSFTFANAIHDVKTVFDYYRLSHAIVIGHSYGGTLGLKYEEAHPDDVRALLLTDAPMDQPGMTANILDRCEEVYVQRNNTVARDNIRALRNGIFSASGYAMNPGLGGSLFAAAMDCGLYQPKASSPARDALLEKLNGEPDAKLLGDSESAPFVGLMSYGHWMTENLLPEVTVLKNKVYGIFGADDGLFSARQLKDIERALPAGHFDLAIDASHNLFLDRQDEFIDFVDRVAARHSPGGD